MRGCRGRPGTWCRWRPSQPCCRRTDPDGTGPDIAGEELFAGRPHGDGWRMTDVMDELVEARRSWVCGAIRSWYTDAELTAHLRSAMANEAHRVANAAFGRDLRNGAGLAGVDDPLDWANRRLELADGGWVVTGIRFQGGDFTRPFVDVISTTGPPTPAGIAALGATVVPAYEAFS